MAVAAASKSNIGIKSSMEANSKTRPSLQGRKSLSSRRLSRYDSMPSDDATNSLMKSNSERLLQLKHRLSLGNKRTDSYHKLDATAESFNASWNTEKSVPHAVSSPALGGTLISTSSKSSDKSSSDILSRAATVAGRKQRAAKRHSDPTGDVSASKTAGISRRRSRRLSQTETVMHHSNDGFNDKGKRRDMFRNDFPGEPIPSDAILMRLYGNMPLAPPPPSPATPHPNAFDEQASASNGSYGSTASPTTTSRSSKSLLLSPGLSKSSNSKPRRNLKSNDLTSDTKGSKNKGDKRRDGLSNSSHHKRDSSQKSKAKRSSETMKIRNKYDSKMSPSEGSRDSDYEAFQALLDLSNGSFFDDDDLNASESMNFMRTSMTSIDAAPLGDKERKKKRKGKRGDGKIRSRSLDENRDTSTKSRRGKRSSKSKTSITEHDRKSLHSSAYDESLKVVARKKSSNADGLKPHRSAISLSHGNLSSRKKNKKGASTKTALQPQGRVEQGSMNSKSPNRDDSTKTKGVTAKEIIATARDILESPKLMGNESATSRWNPQPSPANNASLPRIDNSLATSDSRFDAIPKPNIDESAPPPPPPREPTTPPESPKRLDFHLDFMEYQNVSPLTIASRKIISSDVIGAIDLLKD